MLLPGGLVNALNLSTARHLVRLLTDDEKEIRKLRRACGHELKRCKLEREAWNDRLEGSYRAMSNFMSGVTWAMACRAALRESMHHTPRGGIRPQSGEMWLPREVLRARGRHLAKYGWDPLTAERWWEVRGHLLADMEAANRASGQAKVARFVVPLVEGEVSVRVTQAVMDRFDVEAS
jgi:hypothetical protein